MLGRLTTYFRELTTYFRELTHIFAHLLPILNDLRHLLDITGYSTLNLIKKAIQKDFHSS